MKNGLFRIGLAGSALTALCCVTPLLPWLLGVPGLSGEVGVLWRDAVLLPVLVGFLVLTGGMAWHRKHRR